MDGAKGAELAFAAQCNAAVVKGAESYYRNMRVTGGGGGCDALAQGQQFALLLARILLPTCPIISCIRHTRRATLISSIAGSLVMS